ncbi:hypothetical protein PAECIP111890_00171 [Paenibacillus sp. JJ-223]|nr:hypothetical protein PAECIP111890_00171 [Paenibacillus sp. JJ-223]
MNTNGWLGICRRALIRKAYYGSGLGKHFPQSLLQSVGKRCRMGIEHEEMNRIIFRESAGNDKLVQKAREGGRLSSIKFDVLRAAKRAFPFCLYT